MFEYVLLRVQQVLHACVDLSIGSKAGTQGIKFKIIVVATIINSNKKLYITAFENRLIALPVSCPVLISILLHLQHLLQRGVVFDWILLSGKARHGPKLPGDYIDLGSTIAVHYYFVCS